MTRSLRARLDAAALHVWQTRNPVACLLWPLSQLYGHIAGTRRRSDEARAVHVGLPTVVVGNRIAGGAGKTPTVLAVLAHLRARGWRPGVVSRGHGGAARDARLVGSDAQADQVGDEPLLLHLRGHAPVAVGRDRVAAARLLRATHPEVNVIVSDDGLQHRRLARDVEIVVFDTRGAGNGWLLPAGPLREPIDAPSTAGAHLVLYNADRPSTALDGFTAERTLAGAVALADWWRGTRPTPQALAALRTGRPTACAGIARPEGFFSALEQAGVHPARIALPDHADFRRLPWPDAVGDVVVTEKDAVKLLPHRVARERPRSRVWVAPLDFRPSDAFFAALDAALATRR